MSAIIQHAAKGQRKAMQLLYEANKQKVFYLSLCLLGKTAPAAEAACWVFKEIFGDLAAYVLDTESDFTQLVVRKTVDTCKRRVSRQNPKAFRIPYNRNFLMAGDMASVKRSDSPAADVLARLPDLQRFLFVLRIVGGYTPEQLAGAFKFDAKTVGFALEAEKPNVERVLRQLGASGESYESITEAPCDGEGQTEVPAAVDRNTAAVIDGIALPLERKKRRTHTAAVVIAAVLCLCVAGGLILGLWNSGAADGAVSSGSGTESTDETADTSDTTYTPTALDETLTYYADIEIADYGTITVELDPEAAPITAANFVSLAQSGFYDGLTFHRIMEGFMMQGGDPNGDGTGGSENTIVGEFSDNGYENSLSHTRGAISMARSGDDYDSASSQFFIVQEDSTYLDGQYAVFGYVTEGLEVVDAVCEAAEPTDDNGTIEADAQPVITSITIRTE